jgi:glycosyltransferase involved in cell wall biosynthesis
MVPTKSIKDLLDERGFRNVVLWTRGVDTTLFNPDGGIAYDLPRPIWVYVGRVAVEKNIAAFLTLSLPGSMVVIGEGPDQVRLKQEFPDCHFLGYRFGSELAAHLAGADVFVFPSKTDTFGLVMLEAMACGLPVAALPVTGPVDVVQHGITGMLNHDLAKACNDALSLDRMVCRNYATSRSWANATLQFQSHLAPIEYGDERSLAPQTVK